MNKEYISSLISLITIIILLFLLNIDSRIIVVIVVVCFTLHNYYFQKKVKRQMQEETKELTKTITSQSKDVYNMQKQLTTVASNLPMPLVLMDKNGNVVLYNTEFERFREGNKKIDILSYHDNDFKQAVKHIVNDAFIFEHEIQTTLTVDGITYEAMVVPILSDKRFRGSMILFQDIRMALEKEHLQKRFIADASHELKTPITAIKGMSEILNREGFDDDKTRSEFLKQIEIETSRLENIVSDLLTLSKISNDQIVLNREFVNINTCIKQSMQSFKNEAKRKGIKIQDDLQNKSELLIDKEKMTNVINNLLENAIHYSDTGTITLSTHENDKSVIFEISDEGKGIDRNEYHRIFERFYRIGEDRSRERGGTGLGLSIVKSIVEAHAGKISVHSEVHKGTTFRIVLYKV